MPARFRAVKRALVRAGYEVSKPKKGGSHWKVKDPVTGKVYVIPAHNGLKTEIGDEYIRALCRCYDLDYLEFKNSL